MIEVHKKSESGGLGFVFWLLNYCHLRLHHKSFKLAFPLSKIIHPKNIG